MITTDIQKLELPALIELFEIDLTHSYPATFFRFHAGKNGLLQDIVWQGVTYQSYPIEAAGFEVSGSGTIPRPTITVANTTGLVSAVIRDYKELLGAKVTRKRTLSKYLDSANFVNQNPSADPNQYFPDEVWYIDRRASENKVAVTFELASPWDVQGIKLPRRQIVANTCTWKYRSSECGFAGGAVADKNDIPTSDINLDSCGKRLSSCKMRFGDFSELPYGAFPACGVLN